MHHMQLMMTWSAILGVWWLWAKELFMDDLHANESTLRVQLKVNFLQSTIWCLKYFGQDIFWSPKDTKFMNQYCIKIISCNLTWKMAEALAAKKTRHINIQNFFIKDRIASGEVKLVYCQTKTMLADAFTKPLQGCAFIQLWDSIIMT